MDLLKHVLKKVSYFLGTVIPNATFTIIFITFMLTIVSRYVLKTPITWSYEISILGYMWTMFFGVGKAMEADDHVVFGLVYDHLNPKMQNGSKILYNVILISLIVIAFVPCVDSLLSKKMVTGVLKIPYTIVFAPLIYMFAEIIIRSVIDVFHCVRNIKELEKNQHMGVN